MEKVHIELKSLNFFSKTNNANTGVKFFRSGTEYWKIFVNISVK